MDDTKLTNRDFSSTTLNPRSHYNNSLSWNVSINRYSRDGSTYLITVIVL